MKFSWITLFLLFGFLRVTSSALPETEPSQRLLPARNAESNEQGDSAIFSRLFPDRSPEVWIEGVGSGFQKGARQVELTGGAAFGTGSFGSRFARDFAWTNLHLGWIITDVTGSEDKWYRGNWAFFLEHFAGIQFKPESSKSLVGITPGFRYYLATGRSLIPFIGAGAGIAVTNIREPDLGSAFQFNLQAGGGVQFFLTDHWAATLHFRFIHISNARISLPNSGLDQFTGLLGMSYFF